MKGYGQFCPVAKATEILGDKWTLLIVRELLMGTTRFSDLQRALSKISPTILTKRLKQLEAGGIIERKDRFGQTSREYTLTRAGTELYPVIEQTAIWGMRWARGQLADDELDIYLLMWDIRRRLQTVEFPEGETVLCFTFSDFTKYATWWLVVAGNEVDLCSDDPGKDVDLYVTTDARTMVQVWMGDLPLPKALRDGGIEAIGDRHLVKSMGNWLGFGMFSQVPRPEMPG